MNEVNSFGRPGRGPGYNKELSEDEKDEICRLKVEENMKPIDIGIKVGRSSATILRVLSKRGVSHRVLSKRSTPAFKESVFNEIKQHKEDDRTSVEVAVEIGLSLSEVNIVFLAKNYRDYLERR